MENPEITEPNLPKKAPGSLLTEARLKLGLEPQNVAEMLHLRVHQIHAIEQDDYENLPEPTYVKGYLRAYCQLLSLDADAIVKMYSDLIKPAVQESFEGIAPDKQTASNDNLVKLFSAGLVALVAALTITFWYSSKSDQVDSPVASAVEQAGPVPSVEILADSQEEIALPQAGADGTVEAGEATLAKTPTSEPVAPATGPVQALQPPAQTGEPKVAAPPPVEKSQTALLPEPGTMARSVENQASLLPESDDLARSRLLIRVNEGSWVDVRDARDNKLIYETVPTGREIPLEGLAPFKIFLGNASGVQVFLEGKPYDFSSHQRGLTARFTLGKAPGGR